MLFVQDEEQARVAHASRRRLAEHLGTDIRTEIREGSRFWVGERKHQKVSLRRVARVYREYQRIFDTSEAIRDSTAVARANGYAGGYGTRIRFDAVAMDLGLSEKARELLRRRLEDDPSPCEGDRGP